MEEENQQQAEDFKLADAILKLGHDLSQFTRVGGPLSYRNRDRISDAMARIDEIYRDLIRGENQRQKEIDGEREKLLQEKRYVFEAARGPEDYEGRVWVEQGENRYELPKKDPYDGFNWGYGGTGPNNLTWAIIADCFGNERDKLPAQERTAIHEHVFSLVRLAPRAQDHTLYEHQLRAYPKP